MQAITVLADLKKHQTLEIWLWINVLHISEISHFSKFLKIISKSSVAQAKMVKCILFDLNMAGKTHWKLISPFCDDKYCTTDAYFRFQSESFKNQIDCIL